jgi:hypothetical protein
MPSKSEWPQFEAEDANGFRSFSLFTDRHEYFRVSVRMSAIEEFGTRTARDFDNYSPLEQESFKAAAALLSAKVPGHVNTAEMTRLEIVTSALVNLLDSAARFTPVAFENWFPGLVVIAMQVVSDACVKKTLNNVADAFNVPLVTDEASVDTILADLNSGIRKFLRKPGRRRETPKLLDEMHSAVMRLRLKTSEKPTQEKVAQTIGIDARTLRKNMTSCGIKSWDEMLLACEYWAELNAAPIKLLDS